MAALSHGSFLATGAALVIMCMLLPAATAGIEEFALPAKVDRPLNLAFDEAGALWITLEGPWAVGRYDTEAHTLRLAHITIPRADEMDSLFGLAVAPDGVVWTGSNTHLHRVDPATMNVTSFLLPTKTQIGGGLWVDPAGRVWYALAAAERLVRLDPATNAIEEFPLQGEQIGPVMFEAHGDDVWVTLAYAGTYGRLDPATGVVSMADRNAFAAPVGIAADGEGLWVAEHGANTLARVEFDTGKVLHYPTSPSSHYPISGPNDVLVDRGGAVWFLEHLGERVARLDPDARTLTEYDIPAAPGANPLFLEEAPDGTVWYAAWSKGLLGRVVHEGGMAAPSLPERQRVLGPEAARVEVPDGASLVAFSSPSISGAIEHGVLTIDASEASPGEYLALVSEASGGTAVGRYFVVEVVGPTKESSGLPAFGPVAAALGLLLLWTGRRKHEWT